MSMAGMQSCDRATTRNQTNTKFVRSDNEILYDQVYPMHPKINAIHSSTISNFKQ